MLHVVDFIVTTSLSCSVSKIFNVDKWCALEIWVRGHWKWLKMASFICLWNTNEEADGRRSTYFCSQWRHEAVVDVSVNHVQIVHVDDAILVTRPVLISRLDTDRATMLRRIRRLGRRLLRNEGPLLDRQLVSTSPIIHVSTAARSDIKRRGRRLGYRGGGFVVSRVCGMWRRQ